LSAYSLVIGMSDLENLKVKKYLKQTGLAVAVLLILYGVAYLFNYFSDLINFSPNYVLWMLFQIIMVILLIFIGTRIYAFSKAIRLGDFFRQHRSRSQIAATALGFIAIIPFILFPLPASPWFHSAFFRIDHEPISFRYRLYYAWNQQSGASVRISTVAEFSHGGVVILYDITPIYDFRLEGWIIVPYSLYDAPGLHIEVISPASAVVQLGKIMSGEYVLKIVMSDGTDTFYVQKTDQVFSVTEGVVTEGELVGKNEFEKRLDGFRVEYVGYPVIDNVTKQCIIDRICELGGAILGTENGSTDGWVVYLNFLYAGDESNLRHIITQLAFNNTGYWIRIQSNTGWLCQISQYYFSIAIRNSESSSTVEDILSREHLIVFEQKNEDFLGWSNATIFYGSSATLDKTWAELRENFIELVSHETSMIYWKDFWVSYGC
jgi:hypothetical protein